VPYSGENAAGKSFQYDRNKGGLFLCLFSVQVLVCPNLARGERRHAMDNPSSFEAYNWDEKGYSFLWSLHFTASNHSTFLSSEYRFPNSSVKLPCYILLDSQRHAYILARSDCHTRPPLITIHSQSVEQPVLSPHLRHCKSPPRRTLQVPERIIMLLRSWIPTTPTRAPN